MFPPTDSDEEEFDRLLEAVVKMHNELKVWRWINIALAIGFVAALAVVVSQ